MGDSFDRRLDAHGCGSPSINLFSLWVYAPPDMKDHPTCKYNKETSSVCRRVNGERKCETVWRVWRCCAKEKPVQIYTKSASSEGPGEPQKAFDSPQLFPRRDSGSGGGSMTEDPGEKPMGEMDIDIFAHMLRPFRNLAEDFEHSLQWTQTRQGDSDPLLREWSQHPIQSTPSFSAPHRKPRGSCPEQTHPSRMWKTEQA
ncbi:unnamed protein product [Discosporangium mesarthrocarpum]